MPHLIDNDSKYLHLKGVHVSEREIFDILPDPVTERPVSQEGASINLIEYSDENVQALCKRPDVTTSIIFQAAWAITVSAYAGVEHVSFGLHNNHDKTSLCHSSILAESRIIDIILELNSSTHPRDVEDQQSSFKDLSFKSVLITTDDYVSPSLLGEADVDYDLFISNPTDGSPVARLRSRKLGRSIEKTTDILHTFAEAYSQILSADDIQTLTVSDLNILSRRDHDRIMSFNNDQHKTVMDTFHECFREVVRRAPDAQAICSWGDGDYTYHELDTLTDRLASQLNTKLGIHELETPILICFDKSSTALICMLAIFKAGGAFVCIDPSYRQDRINAIVEASGGRLILTQPEYRDLFDTFKVNCAVECIDTGYLKSLPSSQQGLVVKVKPENAAYIHFTSGSTGTPKGITIEHRQLCTAVKVLAKPMQLTSTSRVLQFAAYIFDLSFGDIFVTLAQGGCICNPSEQERISDLPGAIRRMNVNTACLVPSVARLLRPEDVPMLKTLLLGGEALLQENLQTWGGKINLGAMYGPSECTVWCASQMSMSQQSQVSNIGRGYGANLWVVKSSNHHQLAPIGCLGELVIEGPLLARGYLDPQQTEKAFVTGVQWADSAERRFYKTGDLVRCNADGTLTFVGRKDTQIKLHGRRIELGEIEYHLASHPLVEQSMVILPQTGVHAKRLVAVLALKSERQEKQTPSLLHAEVSPPDLQAIKTFMQSKLPTYMQPQVWITVQAIPLLISGKLDRPLVRNYINSLKPSTPTNEGDESIQQNEPTTVAKTQSIAEIWRQALNLGNASLNDDKTFTSLGGDSFSAMEMAALCRRSGIRVSVEDVLEQDMTLRKLSRRAMEKAGEDVQRPSTMVIKPIWWHTTHENAVVVS